MAVVKAKLLIVDDDPSICTSMMHVLAEIGYRVRSAADGFSALIEIRREIPDLLISDLNMPGMSGFELLSVVRRRFPSIHAIAMSGAFCGDEVPSGILADAFFQKGSSIGSLLKLIESLPWPERMSPNPPSALAPVWIQTNEYDSSGKPWVTIACPECLRTFPQVLNGTAGQIRETDCIYCRSVIRYAVVQPASQDTPLPLQRRQPFTTPAHDRIQKLI